MPVDQAPPPSRLDDLRVRLDLLERDFSSGAAPRDEMTRALQDLQIALEEVEVAEEEMALQNEELLSVQLALQGERERYRLLFELAPDGYLVTDVAGIVLEANRAAADLVRVPGRALRGKPLAVFVAQAERGSFRSLFPRILAGERIANHELTVRARGGARRPALVTVAREEGAANLPGRLLWIVRDVSAAKATAAALRETEERLRHAQRLEAVGRLAGGIAHSFNNLLAAIAFHVELLENGLGPRPADGLTGHLSAIRQAGERAAVIASQLLSFGRKQVLHSRVIAVNDVIAAMESMVRHLIGETVELTLDLDPRAGAILFDLAQFEQLVMNLLVNARDAMPDGGRCRVSTRPVEVRTVGAESGLDLSAGSYVCLAVADSGSGMTPEIRSRIFEPFFTTKERHQGTGLGLAMVHGLVRQGGGDVRVESAPGEGSRFEVFLPRVEAAAEPLPPRQATSAVPAGSEVVLLVEDEENIREPALEILQAQGYDAYAAASGAEALEVARRRSRPIDLLVTDVIMPGMSGSQLAQQLTSLYPEVKVVYMSGYPEDSVARHGVLEPGEHFLQKPFPPSQLLRTIRQVLAGPPPARAPRPRE